MQKIAEELRVYLHSLGTGSQRGRALLVVTPSDPLNEADAHGALERVRAHFEERQRKAAVEIPPQHRETCRRCQVVATQAQEKHETKVQSTKEELAQACLRAGFEADLTMDPASLALLLNEELSSSPALQEALVLAQKLEEGTKQAVEFQQCWSSDIWDMVKKGSEVGEQWLGRECRRLDAALPMYAHREHLVKQVAECDVLVLKAETGSGKSTQVPQYLADCPQLCLQTIVCTQPRKLSALSLCDRVASEWTGESADNKGKFSNYKNSNKSKPTRNIRKELINEQTHKTRFLFCSFQIQPKEKILVISGSSSTLR